MKLASHMYVLIQGLPSEQRYAISQQMWRAAISVPSNIAEGSQRGSDKDFANFILIAKGSLAELETQLLLTQEVGLLSGTSVRQRLIEIEELRKMLYSFHRKLIAQR